MTCKIAETRPVLRISMLIYLAKDFSSSDRTERPVVFWKRQKLVSSTFFSWKFNVEDEVLREKMEKSIAGHDENHELMMVNEGDMFFRIPGLQHSVKKHAQSTSIRQLIHAFQQDLRQNQSLIFPKSKQMIPVVGNIESCELLEKTNLHSVSAILECRYDLLHVRAFLAQGNRNQSEIHQLYDGLSFSSWVRHQERTTSRTLIR